MSEAQMVVAKETIKEMIDLGVIRPSKSPYASCAVLVKKPDGSFRCAIDFRALNRITVKDSFPLPLIDDLLRRVGRAKYFTSLDLYKGYWQVPMDSADIEKTAFNTPFGLYEFTMMPMGLSNSAATFQAMMQEILNPYLHTCCVVYIDDVFIFSDDYEQHLEDIQKSYEVTGGWLKKHALTKPLYKLSTIQNVQVQKTKKGLMSFLGIIPTTVDQNGKRTNERPICFSSKGMNKHQLNYSVTEKEGLAVVWATDLYRSMLVGRHFILETDHSALRQLLTTRDPAGRLCRWMLKLQELDMDIFHKKGRDHIPADFMTR
ncbi:unnamed protein product, partial [Heterosigma akashiwo]